MRFYFVRVRSRLAGECFAVLGIAAGVALLFASQSATSSLQNSVGVLERGLAGNATLQLRARDAHGFPQAVLSRVRSMAGVHAASPVLEADANAVGPRGQESVRLIGADSSLASLGGALVRRTSLAPFGNIGAIVLPAEVAHAIGVTRFGQEATLQVAGRATQAPLYAQLSGRSIGSLASSPVAIAPLSFVQEIAGLAGRLSRILVQPAKGAESRVRLALAKLAGDRLNVEGIGYDEDLLARAATASNQSTRLFAAIGALVGFLFAFNAMLLTVPQRRRLVAGLRRDGFDRRTVVGVLLLDAGMLGALSSVLGLLLGEELSRHLLHPDTTFLSLAFAIGGGRAIGWQGAAVACGGGLLAGACAVMIPLRDAIAGNPLAAVRLKAGRDAVRNSSWQALAGLMSLAAASLVLILLPQATVAGMGLLLCALLLELPLVLDVLLAMTRRLAERFARTAPHVAAMEVASVRPRAIAIAATGAVAVFGGVAIDGAHDDLLSGLLRASGEMNAATQLWVAPRGSYNLFDTAFLRPVDRARLERLPGVSAVSVYRSSLLDYGERRVLAIAPPPSFAGALLAHELMRGDARSTARRLRAGGWVVLSQAIAEEHGVRIGQTVTLPTPRPTALRVAALSTNLSWAPGAVVMSPADFARAWASPDASAYAVSLDPNVSPAREARRIERLIGPGSALAVRTSAQRARAQRTLDQRALARLTQIAVLIPIAAVLAMAAAMGAMIWQRRVRLAALRLDGLSRAELWASMVIESLLLLAAGCVLGALFGLYGQQLADRVLAETVNFPVVRSLTAAAVLSSLTPMALTAALALVVPGYLASGVPGALALYESS